MIIEIINYFMPISSFEWFFFLIIFTLSMFTALIVKNYAKDQYWLAEWNKISTHETTRISIYGSMQELSQKIAGRGEKIADILPGLLLIIGLLGTFVGLGLALNKASLILQAGNTSELTNSMTQLMSMMQGLGTKFKTSSWGIIGYLMFKTWSSINDYEGRRLEFCVNMLKDHDKNSKKYTENKDLVQTSILSTQKEMLIQQSKMSVNLEKSIINFQEMITQNAKITNILDKIHMQQYTNADKNYHQMQTLQGEMRAVKESLGNISTAATQIERSAVVFSTTASKLDKTVNNLSGEMSNIFDNLKVNINLMLTSTSQNLSEAVDKITEATHLMSKELESTLNSVQSGIKEVLTETSAELKVSTEAVHLSVKDMGVETSKVMAEMSKTVEALKEGVSNVLNETSHDLRESIKGLHNTMGEVTHNLNGVMGDVNQIIHDLHHLVNHLKEYLTSLLHNVDQSLQRSIDTQEISLKDLSNLVETLQKELQNSSNDVRISLIEVNRSINNLVEFRESILASHQNSLEITNKSISEINNHVLQSQNSSQEAIKSIADSILKLNTILENRKSSAEGDQDQTTVSIQPEVQTQFRSNFIPQKLNNQAAQESSKNIIVQPKINAEPQLSKLKNNSTITYTPPSKLRIQDASQKASLEPSHDASQKVTAPKEVPDAPLDVSQDGQKEALQKVTAPDVAQNVLEKKQPSIITQTLAFNSQLEPIERKDVSQYNHKPIISNFSKNTSKKDNS